jgi:hypothetical protein
MPEKVTLGSFNSTAHVAGKVAHQQERAFAMDIP